MKRHTLYHTFLMVSVVSMVSGGCLEGIYAEEKQEVKDPSKAGEGTTPSVEDVGERRNFESSLPARQEKKEKVEGKVSESEETEKQKKADYLKPISPYGYFRPSLLPEKLPEGVIFGKQGADFLDPYQLRMKTPVFGKTFDGNTKFGQNLAFQVSLNPFGYAEDVSGRAREKHKSGQTLIDYSGYWEDPVAKPHASGGFYLYFGVHPFHGFNSWYVDYRGPFEPERGVFQGTNTSFQEGSKEWGSSMSDSAYGLIRPEPVAVFNSPGLSSASEIPEPGYPTEGPMDLEPGSLMLSPVHLQYQSQDLGGIK